MTRIPQPTRRDSRAPDTTVRTLAAASVVGAFAVVVSATGSWIPSLWGDEAASVLSATRPLGSLMVMLTHVDAVHGLSYLMLHGWIALFGSTPFAVRFPSALGVGVCAGAVVWLCRRFGGLAFAVTAGVLTAILPELTDVGAEARSYAIDAALAALVCVIVVEILRRPTAGRRWWIAYAVVLAVGIYAFMYVVLMIPAVAAMIALTPGARRLWRRAAVWSGAAVLAASPVIVAALIEHEQIAFLAGRHRASAYDVLVGMWFWQPAVAAIGWLLIAVAAVGWAADAVHARRTGRRLGLRLEAVAFAWLVVPMGMLLASNAVIADFTSRYGAFAAPSVAVAMALGLRRVTGLRRITGLRRVTGPRRTPRAVRMTLAGLAVVAFVVAIAPVWASQRGPYAQDQSDWTDIAATVSHDAVRGEGIVFDEAARPSRSPRLAMDTDPAPFRGLRDVTLRTPYQRSPLWYGDAYSIPRAAALGRFDGVSRVWLVETAYGAEPSTWGRRSLQRLGYRLVRGIRLHSSELLLYRRDVITAVPRPASAAAR